MQSVRTLNLTHSPTKSAKFKTNTITQSGEFQVIVSLTQEQKASLSAYRDQWIDHGLDTSALDYDAIVAAVKLAYNLADQREPKYFLFVDGPTEAMKFLNAAPTVTLTEDDFKQLASRGPLALTEAIRNFVDNENSEKKVDYHWPSFYGQHEAGWLGFYQFFADHFGLSEKSAGLRELGRQCGWVWMYADIVIVSRKPIRVTMNNQGRLHNEKMAAIEYADGTKVYAFNGVSIPEEWVLQRDTIDPSVILKCPDTDKRAAGIALFGYSRLKHALNYKIIQGDPSTDIGALVEIEIPGLSRKGRFLEAICPRNGPVFLGVPDTNPWDGNKKILDAVGAQAFLARLPRSDYEHPAIRT
jgi:hypothetical protein